VLGPFALPWARLAISANSVLILAFQCFCLRRYGSIDVRQCQFVCGMALLVETCEGLFERRGASSMSMDRE